MAHTPTIATGTALDEAHFLEQPAAEVLQRENVTAPAANVSPENQRRQDRQSKKDEACIEEPLLQRVHNFRRLDGRNRLANYAPLDDVRDHEQIEKDQRRGAPPAGL